MPQHTITFMEVTDQYLTLSNNFHDKSLHESAQKALESGILSKWQPMPIADTRAHLNLRISTPRRTHQGQPHARFC